MSRALLMPWSCREEWEEVYSWLYSSDPALVKRGVGRVSAWKARGRVPMMVEMTANLCECRVCDRETEKSAFQVLSLQYSMAITRYCAFQSLQGLVLWLHKKAHPDLGVDNALTQNTWRYSDC